MADSPRLLSDEYVLLARVIANSQALYNAENGLPSERRRGTLVNEIAEVFEAEGIKGFDTESFRRLAGVR